MKNILFLCTGNSCRSQMAEGFAKYLHGDKYHFYSAGITKHGLNPYAVGVMKEVGIDISGHESNTLEELADIKLDTIFTVCSNAHETCPIISGVKTIHIGFDDPPTLSQGVDDPILRLNIYRRVRDEIEAFIKKLPSQL